MRILKTIVATTVIVFALTTVALAGVQHFTKQSGQATGTQSEAAQPTYTVTLTAAQLAQLMNGGKVAASNGAQHARRALPHAKAARRHTASHHAGDATRPSASGSGGSAGTHRYEATYDARSQSSGSGSHHAETGHHSGGGHDGGSCGD